MSTPEREHFQQLVVRRPDDVDGAVPLAWQMEMRGVHTERLMNNTLPADFEYDVERGDAGDALAVLALGESMRRDLDRERASRVHDALRLGATWREVAAALDITPDEARALLRSWADRQHRLLYLTAMEAGRRPFGLDADAYAAVLDVCELGDDESAVAGVAR